MTSGILSAVMLAAGLSFGQSAAGGTMQVEEPSLSQSSPPINPERESMSWQAKTRPHALTEEQKSAMRDRRERMKAMVAELKQKRKAMDDATPEEKAALARELHSFILEKEEHDGDEGERMRQMEQERRSKQMELQQEKLRLLHERLQHRGQDKTGSGKDATE
jgi:uncharacterized coiled-coil protein SlyX